MKLFEITAEIRQLADEDLTPEQAAEKFQQLAGDFNAKVRGTVAVALELQKEAEAIAEVAKRTAERAKPLQARAEWLLANVKTAIESVEAPLPIKFPEFTINLAKMPPKVEIGDESKIQTEYLTRTVSFVIKPEFELDEFEAALPEPLTSMLESREVSTVVKKAAILSDLKEGVIVFGAHLPKQSYRLSIK